MTELEPTLEEELERISSDAFVQAFARGLRPEPRITVSEWADRNRILSSRSSKETGPWRTSRFPFLREIMDCLSTTSPVQDVVFEKGSQIGGTEVGNNWLGYIIDHAPGPTMVVLPSGDTGTRKSRQTLDPLLEDTPSLASKVSARKSRDPGNTATLKVFPGGILVVASAGSAPALRSMPVRYLFLDEVDAYPPSLEGEGDPVDLAERGTRTYFTNRKVFRVSTPTIEGRSRIDFAFRQTDRRFFHVPCPHCGAFQRIEWGRIRWDMTDDEDRLDVAAELKNGRRSAWLECESCRQRIDEWEKPGMLERGVWVPEDPSRGELVRGYHLSALYSPFGFYPWSACVARFLEAQNNPEKLRVWVNQDLGQTWKEKGDAPEWRVLYERRESYPSGTVPVGGRFLTAGVDVQANRIEVEVVAWAPGFESWSVDYLVFPGDTEHDPEPWAELDRLLVQEWPHADGGEAVQIAALGVDTGFATQTVYGWLRRFGRSRRVFGLKGRTGTQVLVGTPSPVEVHAGGRRIQRGVAVWPVDTGMAKEQLYGWLGGRPPVDPGHRFPIGYCHFPGRGPEYFKGLTSEVLVRRHVKSGRIVHEWEKIRERNEPLDCRVYARAVAYILGMDRWTPEDWNAVRRVLASRRASAPQDATPTDPTPATSASPKTKTRSSRWRRRGPRRT